MGELATSFWLGVGAAASPCLLPLYPTFLAMLAARRADDGRAAWAFLGLAVVLGVVTALTLVEIAVTAVSTSLSGILAWVVPLSTLLLVVLGVLLVLGRNRHIQTERYLGQATSDIRRHLRAAWLSALRGWRDRPVRHDAAPGPYP